MTTDEELEELRDGAEECVELVRADFGRALDFSLASLGILDLVCAELQASHQGGWGDEEQAEQWWRAIGCYAGEVLVRERAGRWIDYDGDEGPYAVEVGTSTAFPFEVSAQVLTGVADTSLAAFGREVAP